MTAQAGSPVATISVTSKGEAWGEIVLRLFPDVAPNHVKN
ncbi:MAG: peptidylprolyl isomerase, partial [Nitrospira sp.]|nr:peptidylprolyl isomerase [Nitrospira sp.]